MKLTDSPCSPSLTRERRRVRRRRVDSVVYIHIGRENGGIILDLCEEGMCISVANPLAVSSEIHFEVGFGDAPPAKGLGHVCWLSESGRSAGVHFLSFPNESRMRIRQWLDDTAELTEKTEPPVPVKNNATAKPIPSAPSRETPDPRETETATGFSRDSERQGRESTLYLPLFFLPKGAATDELAEQFSSPEEPGPWRAENTNSENGGETVPVYRAALAGQPDRDGQTSAGERRDANAVILFTVFLTLLAAGIAALVTYPKRFAELRQFTASPAAPATAVPAAPVNAHGRERRIRRRPTRKQVFVPSGPKRGNRPFRDSSPSEASADRGTQGFEGGGRPPRQRWLARASSLRLAPNEATKDKPADTIPSNPSAYSGEPTSGSTPATPSGLPFTLQTENRRADGNWIEEGSVTPIFAPLNLDGQILDAKRIVVQAVIGTDGRVKDVRLVSSPASDVAQAVVAAVRQWRYRPFYRNGQPVEYVTRITVDFERAAPR